MADRIRFGMTDLQVNRHGFGAARIGEEMGVDGVRALFNTLREGGSTLSIRRIVMAKAKR